MNIKSFYLLSFLTFFFNTQSLLSQENFTEGTIITKDKQTLNVLLDLNTCKTNSDKIFFKTFGSDTLKYLLATEVLSFAVNNQYFESANIYFDPEIRSKVIESEQDYKPSGNTVFVLQVAKGNPSLYVYYDKNNNEYFFIKKDGDFTFLVCYDYYVIDEATGSKSLKRNESFKKQLLSLFIDNQTVASKIKDTEYSSIGSKGINQLFELNKVEVVASKIENSDIIFDKKINKIQFAIKAGSTIEDLSIDYKYKGIAYSFDFPYNINYSFGLSIGYSFLYSLYKPTIHLEWTGAPFSYSKLTTHKNYINLYDTLSFSFSGFCSSVQALVDFNLIKKKDFSLYVLAGLGFNTASIKENFRKEVNIGNFQTKYKTTNLVERYPILLFSCGMGIKYKHVFLETRIKTTSSIDQILQLEAFNTIKSGILFIGYSF